jgi:hypothetical protein
MDWLVSMRATGLVPLGGVVFIAVGVHDLASRLPVITLSEDYRVEPGDDLTALAGLGVEIVFDCACGFHRLRILCENVLAADPFNLILLPVDEPRLVILKRGLL